MRVAITRFPGSNCDQDALYSLREDVGVHAEYVWQDETSLAGFDAVVIPGGFTFGDYLRVGAMASRTPVIDEVRRFAAEGRPVLGVCNGFQILCEAGILPGATMQNVGQKFICDPVWLAAANRTSLWTRDVDRPIQIPIAHGQGRYVCDEETLQKLEGENLIAFRYVDPSGHPTETANVNGSMGSIAGLVNSKGNVLGMMPHPERATKALLGSADGLQILRAITLVRV